MGNLFLQKITHTLWYAAVCTACTLLLIWKSSTMHNFTGLVCNVSFTEFTKKAGGLLGILLLPFHPLLVIYYGECITKNFIALN